MNATLPSPDGKTGKPQCRRLDAAYGCFAFIALALAFGPLLWILPISQGGKEGFAMLLGVPIMFAAFAAGIVGLVLSIVHLTEWPLAVMSVAGVLFLLTWNLDEKTMELAAVFYLVMLVFFCGRWFFYRRKKLKQAEVS